MTPSVLSWLITGNLTFAGSIASAETVTKIALYYFHERAWGAVRWGEKKHGLVVVPKGTSAIDDEELDTPKVVHHPNVTDTAALFRKKAVG